jgi:GT2 family glycosyltransferase
MVAQRFPDIRLVRNPENLGFAAGCNAGLEVATGRYLLLLNPDTIVLDDVLAATVRYLDKHAGVGAVGCRVLNGDGSLQRSCFRDPSVLNTFLSVTGLAKLPWPRFLGREWMTHWQRDSERDVDVVTGCYLATRREVVEDVGPLDAGYFFCGEEADWCRRMRARGWVLRFAPVGEIIHLDGVAGRKLSERWPDWSATSTTTTGALPAGRCRSCCGSMPSAGRPVSGPWRRRRATTSAARPLRSAATTAGGC